MTAQLLAATREAYARWAPLYPPEPHNPLMRAEQRVMLEVCPPPAGLRVLDLGCGTGRYAQMLAKAGAAHVVAVDFCMPMLSRLAGAERVCAGMTQLPFAARSFDIVISGLAVGHVPDLGGWAAEMARILRDGGSLVYSDFHPDAARAHLTRSFRDQEHRRWTVPHVPHALDTQLCSLQAAGLKTSMREVRVGRELSEPFENCADFYARFDGLALVLIVRADK